jgi:hypothetical protein
MGVPLAEASGHSGSSLVAVLTNRLWVCPLLFNARRRYSSRRGPPARCSFQNCMFRAREVL